MLELPKSKVAAVQTAPVYLDPAATVDKACALIAEAAGNGAKLVAFPEVFVAGYPYWNWLMTPVEGSEWFERLCRAAITVPGPEVEQLCAAARAHDCTVVIGVNERDPRALGTLYNTNLVIGADGTLLGRHRKLVPTWAEKLTWAGGDGASLRVYDTPVGPLGTLACGENTNTLARFALLSAGELVHVANYISLPVAPASYNMADAIRIRATAHSFEGKLFTIVACSTVSEEIIAAMSAGRPENRALLERRQSAFSGVIGPDGNLVGDPLIDDEGIVYAEIDLSRCIQPKQMHDIIGAYNRFDIFDLRIDRRPRTSASWRDDEVPPADDGGAEPPTA
ncbi:MULTISPECIES: carbon-nitrogen hydrolase family protein [unclassified Sphingopyxis]|uniref:carbon-nitrogen hydrolase family protein n=1 Tax=unclassified Sphingopyxis TaxID=2614943 RepID=UPI0019604299|nr:MULTISPECIES: carbon-nitrogen hydrolase family protein [unclassified Sphingopyxis]